MENYRKLLILGACVLVGLMIFITTTQHEAFAQQEEGDTGPSQILASIAQSEYVQLSLIIVVIGVGIRVGGGMINKSLKEIDYKRIAFTMIVAGLTSINVVMPILQQIDPKATGEIWFLAMIMGILTVAGSDAVGSSGSKFANKVVRKNNGPINQ